MPGQQNEAGLWGVDAGLRMPGLPSGRGQGMGTPWVSVTYLFKDDVAAARLGPCSSSLGGQVSCPPE